MVKWKWSEDEKKLVVLELLKGGKSVSQLSKERGISDALIYCWRDQALKAMDGAFRKNGRNGASDFSAERDRLLKIIGEQACVIETLKKFRECVNRWLETHNGYSTKEIHDLEGSPEPYGLKQEQLLLREPAEIGGQADFPSRFRA